MWLGKLLDHNTLIPWLKSHGSSPINLSLHRYTDWCFSLFWNIFDSECFWRWAHVLWKISTLVRWSMKIFRMHAVSIKYIFTILYYKTLWILNRFILYMYIYIYFICVLKFIWILLNLYEKSRDQNVRWTEGVLSFGFRLWAYEFAVYWHLSFCWQSAISWKGWHWGNGKIRQPWKRKCNLVFSFLLILYSPFHTAKIISYYKIIIH